MTPEECEAKAREWLLKFGLMRGPGPAGEMVPTHMVESLASLLAEVAQEARARRSTGDPTLDRLRDKAEEWIEAAGQAQLQRTLAHLAKCERLHAEDAAAIRARSTEDGE